jgi:hypothetical protein
MMQHGCMSEDEARLPVISWNDLSPAAREWLREMAAAENKPLLQVLAEVLEVQARGQRPGLSLHAEEQNEAV